MLFITGTDTGVGKTYASSYILNELTKKISSQKLLYYKPVQSGYIKGTGDDDAGLIKKLSSNVSVQTSYRFKYPGAPMLGAELENTKIDENKILEDFNSFKKDYEFIIAEGAGGIAVPLNEDVLYADLIKLMNIPVLIVAKPDLGTINHSVLTVNYARSKGLEIVGVLMSQYSHEMKGLVNYQNESLPLHIKTAPQMIADIADIEVFLDARQLVEKKLRTLIDAS